MARSGRPSRLSAEGPARSVATKRALVDAAIETLRSDGFAGASARAIASRAECNQALVFYHFGSVAELLLAALDEVSELRLARYSEALDGVTSPAQLVDVAAAIFREDLDAGYVTVLVEMIAGASSTPGLGPAVAARLAPWRTFAQRAIETAVNGTPLAALVPSGEVAGAVVALYLGLELLSHLDGDRDVALALFARARQLAPFLELLGASPQKET
jgi:AcrR family transcriptional regulator